MSSKRRLGFEKEAGARRASRSTPKQAPQSSSEESSDDAAEPVVLSQRERRIAARAVREACAAVVDVNFR